MKRRLSFIARLGIVMAAFVLVAFTPYAAQAVSYDIHNFLILVDDQLILKGPANVNCCFGAPIGERSDVGSRNIITLGGTATTAVPVGAPALKDVAVIAPNVVLHSFAKVSMVIFDQATGSYTVSGTGIVQPNPGNLFNDLGNNPLNNTGIKDLPPFPVFPTITPGAADVVVPANGTVNLPAGNYRDLIIGANATVNFQGPAGGVFQFRRILSITDSSYHINFLANDIQVLVKEFVHLDEFGAFNESGKTGITLFVEGFDGTYGGANKNKNGVVRAGTALPAAFEFGGDGPFIACFAFVKNGTINLRGITQYATQWFGNSLQEISNLTINLQSPGQNCIGSTPCPCCPQCF